MCAVEIKLGRDSYHDPEYTGKKISDNDRVTIYIHTMVGEEPLAIKITELHTVEDVCN